MSTPSVRHWYKVPGSVVEQQRKDGITPVITEFAIRPLTGDDEAAASVGLKEANMLRNRLIDRALCGVNYDLTQEQITTKDGPKDVYRPNPSRRIKLQFGGDDPNTYPENVRKGMHLRVFALLMGAFSKHNDGTTEEAEDFFASQETETA